MIQKQLYRLRGMKYIQCYYSYGAGNWLPLSLSHFSMSAFLWTARILSAALRPLHWYNTYRKNNDGCIFLFYHPCTPLTITCIILIGIHSYCTCATSVVICVSYTSYAELLSRKNYHILDYKWSWVTSPLYFLLQFQWAHSLSSWFASYGPWFLIWIQWMPSRLRSRARSLFIMYTRSLSISLIQASAEDRCE